MLQQKQLERKNFALTMFIDMHAIRNERAI